jgi:pimeloyl-ACP methyl ester carboxylesterase
VSDARDVDPGAAGGAAGDAAADAASFAGRAAGADLFADVSEPGLPLRRYDPVVPGPRPLIVFLHGGAEAGDDNRAQLLGTAGAVELAQRYPDHMVLAPQAPAPTSPVMPPRLPFPERVLDPETGWSRTVLAAVAAHVRGLIDAGRVDPARVLLTGVSMGGAGVLRMLDLAPDLVAGAAPVCPTMTPETFGYLRGLDRGTSLWVSSAYVDHTPDRHKYLADGVLELVRAGAPDVHLTLFSPEQLAAVGIPSRPDLDTDALLVENHAAWVLTYSDAEGILGWLTTRRKDAR